MTVLVDSWSWIEYFISTPVGVKDVARVLDDPQSEVIVSTVNIAEVYKAFLRDFPYPENQRLAEASRAAIIQRSYVFDVDQEIAVESAKINHKMKLGLGDSIMYATAIREGAEVLTGDPHFKGVKDVIYLGK
jgi:predicted nucleic acid-binding protein